MGIDIYMHWDNQTEKEKENQITGFSTTVGNVGYLREAYHGGPYATKILLPESFDDDPNIPPDLTDDQREDFWSNYHGPQIEIKVLVKRLPHAIVAAFMRDSEIYGNTKARDILISLGIEPTLADGSDPSIIDADDDSEASDKVMAVMSNVFSKIIPNMEQQKSNIVPLPSKDETTKLIEAAMKFGGMPRSLVEFCALAAKKQQDTNLPVSIYASY